MSISSSSGDCHFDLAVIGTGSGNSVVDERFADRRVALLEKGTFGGTCLNVGCIPTKMFVYPADIAYSAAHGGRLGLETRFHRARWPEIRERIFGRIDPISIGGRFWRAEKNENVTLFEGHTRFVDVRTLDTGTGRTITADQVVIAAGSRPVLPEVEGLSDVAFHTSDTIMRIDDLPDRLLILGGGFVAAEFAHVFASFGTRVTIVNRSARLLRAQDDEISERFTEVARRQWDVRLEAQATKVERYDGGVRAHLSDGSTVHADTVLVAVGRISNADGMDLEKTGVERDADGVIVVDEYQRTNVDGIWALGDVANYYQLKHVSNHEARVVQHNLLHPGDLGVGEDRVRDEAVVTGDRGVGVQQVVLHHPRLVVGHVLELVGGGHVPQGVDMLGGGALVLVHHDVALVVDLDPGGGQLQGVAVGAAAGGDQEHVRRHVVLARGVREREGHPVSGRPHPLDGGAGAEVDAAADQVGEALGHLGVLLAQHPRPAVDDGHPGAVGGEDVGELSRDVAPADDHQRARQLG